jgi:gamma-glutamyltranspeptidase/glutathione hydrolase
LIRNGSDGTIKALDFRETAPLAATEKMYLDENDEVRPNASTYGALAAGVPGTVAGLYELWQKYGSLPWEQLLTPAANLADTGFIVDEYMAKSLAEYSDAMVGFESTAHQYLPGGRAPVAGERLQQPELAATLYIIAAEGPDGFYRGKVAEKIVATMQEYGGIIDHSDLEDYSTQWRTPTKFRFDSLDIYSMPPPSSGGICVGQILSMLQPFDFAAWSPQSLEYIHLFTEVSKLSFADRSEHLGDPDYYDVPSGLLSQYYLDNRAALIDIDQATPSQQILPGEPGTSESDQTTHYNVCDSSGNMVAITYTLNAAYGSKLVVGGAGFLLNNEMDDFSIKPGHPNSFGLIGGEANKIESGKRMLSSMSPTLIMLHDRPFMALGSPGGSKIITVVAQAIVNFTRFHKTLNETVKHPRFHHQWQPDVLYLEQGSFDINIIQGLIVRGHNVKECEPYGDLQIIHYSEDGLIAGASDPRGGGSVGGY